MMGRRAFLKMIGVGVTVVAICSLGFGGEAASRKPDITHIFADGGVSAPIASGEFRSPLLKRKLPFRVFAPNKSAGGALATVVYVKNLALPRLGTVADSKLIGSFFSKGMLVVEVDYEKDPLVKGANFYSDIVHLYRVFGGNRKTKAGGKGRPFSPLMDEFIGWDNEKITTYEKFVADRGGKSVEYEINPLWVYVIPAGYTIDRNVEVSTIETEKRKVVHRMDIIHPASPAKPVPAVLEISTFMPPEDPALHTRINRNSCYVFAWMTAGYAGVIMDNVANHVTSNWIYDKQMTVPTGPHFPEKRALRLLRARKGEWGLSGKVAVMGISKCNMRAIVSGLLNAEQPNRKYVLEADKGPHAEQSDRFDVMIAGGFPRRAEEHQGILDYLSADDPALVWCQSTYESRKRRAKYRQDLAAKKAVLRQIEKKCEGFGLPCRTFFGTPIGHDFDYVYLRDIMGFVEPYMK